MPRAPGYARPQVKLERLAAGAHALIEGAGLRRGLVCSASGPRFVRACRGRCAREVGSAGGSNGVKAAPGPGHRPRARAMAVEPTRPDHAFRLAREKACSGALSPSVAMTQNPSGVGALPVLARLSRHLRAWLAVLVLNFGDRSVQVDRRRFGAPRRVCAGWRVSTVHACCGRRGCRDHWQARSRETDRLGRPGRRAVSAVCPMSSSMARGSTVRKLSCEEARRRIP